MNWGAARSCNFAVKDSGRTTIDSVLELAVVLGAVEVAFRFCDEPVIVDLPKFVATGSFATNKNPLLHICDLYDTALCLRVLWVLHHGHV